MNKVLRWLSNSVDRHVKESCEISVRHQRVLPVETFSLGVIESWVGVVLM